MATAPRQKSKVRQPPRRAKPSRHAPAKKAARPAPKKAATAPKKPLPRAGKSPAAPSPKASPKAKESGPELQVPLPDGRRHVLSLSFVRDGDEFLARLETDSGHITEFKNRSLDQLLTLVAGELEDLVE
jgi:hypothetical protein